MTDRPRSVRDRPLGLAPTGTSVTFGLGMLYPFFTYAFMSFALLPWISNGTDDDFLGWASDFGFGAIGGFVLTVALSVPYTLLFQARRYAAVCIFFSLGVISAIAVPLALLVLAGLLLSSLGHEPDLVILTYLFGGCLLAMLATWPWLVRGLRLKYWQPWTTPDQWEVGDERLARWAQDLAGVEDRRPATDGTRPPPRRRRR